MNEVTQTTSDVAEVDRELGAIERATAEVFERRGWRTVTLEQTGPDGTEVLSMLLFHICPICSACIPLGTEDDPLPDEHRDWHIGEAQALDETATALKMLLGMAGIPQDEPTANDG